MKILEPALRVIRADNPSPMTLDGTNTYIIGDGPICVIDPGPDDADHLAGLMAIIRNSGPVAAVLVTHSHRDHSPLAPKLAHLTSAPVMAYGDSNAGRSALMTRLAEQGLAAGGEGVDTAFRPDRLLQDNAVVKLGQDDVTAIWTPGHMGNHMCFQWRGAVFCGDHVMGWASSLVSPPDGNLGDYMRSLKKLADLKARVLYPGHGLPVYQVAERIDELIQHRQEREAAILAELSRAPCQIADLVHSIYADVPAALHAAAARNVYAHLIALFEAGIVTASPNLAPDARYSAFAPR